ncbi:amidase [Nisaea sp.]|uniref:amidase n=1 Tax=Nisaea sp. TaxID=2024842 RepID=UPI0032973749
MAIDGEGDIMVVLPFPIEVLAMSAAPKNPAPLWQWSAVELSGAIRDARVSASDAVSSVVERIRAENGHLNAIVFDQTEAAKEQAASYDEILKTDGPIGPLHGVPVAIKINVDQKGTANSNGVVAFKDVIAPEDAPVVRNLKKAGAIIVGRTNTPEFSFRATTVNELHGRTYNPWDDNHSPGGSSGGASSAVAAGFCPIAHGNDIGGSLRFPAYQTGAVTVRPTLGRVPAYNPSGKEERSLLAQLMSVQGIIAREVRDVRLATKVMAGYDARDPMQVPLPFEGPAVEQPIKVALCRETNGYSMHPAIDAALEKTAEQLEKAGYRVEEAAPPMIREAAAEALPALYADCEIFIGEVIKKYGSAEIQKAFDFYFENYPPTDAEGLLRAMSRRTRYLREWNVFLEDYPLVLTPFMMRPGFTWNEDLESSAGTKDIFDSSVYSWLINFLGLPASIAPADYHDGLPISVQIIGRRFREDLTLDAAEALERVNGVQIHELWKRKGLR